MKSPVTKASDIQRRWHLIDLQGQILGRVASRIASLLSGKNKVNFSPNLDLGDYVVTVNSDQIKVTGKKMDQKIYARHSGYPGGFKEQTLAEKLTQDSTKVIELAVKGMLPKNKLQDQRLRRLKVFKTADHPYQSQFQTK